MSKILMTLPAAILQQQKPFEYVYINISFTQEEQPINFTDYLKLLTRRQHWLVFHVNSCSILQDKSLIQLRLESL